MGQSKSTECAESLPHVLSWCLVTMQYFKESEMWTVTEKYVGTFGIGDPWSWAVVLNKMLNISTPETKISWPLVNRNLIVSFVRLFPHCCSQDNPQTWKPPPALQKTKHNCVYKLTKLTLMCKICGGPCYWFLFFSLQSRTQRSKSFNTVQNVQRSKMWRHSQINKKRVFKLWNNFRVMFLNAKL